MARLLWRAPRFSPKVQCYTTQARPYLVDTLSCGPGTKHEPCSLKGVMMPTRDLLTEWRTIRVNGKTLCLLCPATLDRLVDLQALLRDDASPEPPYWAHVWSASRVLASQLAQRGLRRGQRLLDVGCGLGLTALAAAQLGARVYAFDLEPQPLAFLRASALANDLPVSVWRGDLLRPAVGKRFDWITAADVTYDAQLRVALVKLAEEALTFTGRLLCADSVRTYDEAWLDPCRRSGWTVDSCLVQDVEDGRPIWVRLVELSRSLHQDRVRENR